MRPILIFLYLLVAQALTAQSWLARQGVSIPGTSANGFWEFKPSTYNGVTKHAAIIFIHGLGNVGNGTSDLGSIDDLALPMFITQNQAWFDQYNTVLIAPQFSTPWPSSNSIESVINYVRDNYSIDTSRVYLTGLSMGGGAILDWAETGSIYKVAAIAAVCPASTWQSFGNRYKAYDMPIWLSHGTVDGTVAFTNSTGWLTNLNAATAIVPLARMDTLVGADHNIWNDVYADYWNVGGNTGYNAVEWMRSYTRTNYTGVPSSGGGGGPVSDTIRVDVGGTTQTYDGKLWYGLEEGQVSGGTFASVMSIWGEDRTITNATTAPQAIYKSSRMSASAFTVNYPVTNGTYTLRLHFCEYWRNSAVNTFNVSVEGTQVLTNYDIWTIAGGRYVAKYEDMEVTISDGSLTIAVNRLTGEANLNGFELIPAGGPATIENTLIADISGTKYRFYLYSDNTYIAESFNGSVWQSASPSNLSLRGTISGTSYKWVLTSGGTYSTLTFTGGSWQ